MTVTVTGGRVGGMAVGELIRVGNPKNPSSTPKTAAIAEISAAMSPSLRGAGAGRGVPPGPAASGSGCGWGAGTGLGGDVGEFRGGGGLEGGSGEDAPGPPGDGVPLIPFLSNLYDLNLNSVVDNGS